MELLVYARNYRSLGSNDDSSPHRDLGVVVGEPAPPVSWGERLCSFVEIRLPITVIDPSTEIELLIAKAFAVWGRPGGGRVLRFANDRGRVSLLLEPGFERTRDLCHALRPVLPQARAMLDRAVHAAKRRNATRNRTTRPELAVPTAADRVASLQPPSFRYYPPVLLS